MGLISLMLFFLYWAPSVVAVLREHPRAGTLFLVNFCFGWTIIGWVACMVWAWTQGTDPDR
jgi:hypothetical protein